MRTLARIVRQRSSSALPTSSSPSGLSASWPAGVSSSRSNSRSFRAHPSERSTVVSKDVYLTDASDARAQANASPNATGIYDILSSGLVHRAMAKCYAQSRLQAWLSTDVAQTGRPEVDAFLYSLIAWTEQPPTTPSVKRARDDLHQLLSRGHINTAEYVALESRIDLLSLFGKRVLATLYLSYSTFLLRNAEQFGRPDLEAMRQTQAAMLALRDGHMFDRSDMANINTAISRLILQRLG